VFFCHNFVLFWYIPHYVTRVQSNARRDRSIACSDDAGMYRATSCSDV
jgi:hypothetical protein